MTRHALLPTLLTALLLVCAPGPAGAAPAHEHLRLRAAVRALPVADETPLGYDRDLFTHWVDADHDCQDTREEVLVAESRVPVDGCTVTTGEWFSWYDRETWTRASDVDIDHLVPLKEAWDSGARAWDADTRERYANDLGDPRTLVAVTDNVNQSKGDRDVAEWLPDYGVCRYVRQWTAVKLRWGLTVDPDEKATLRQRARHCRNRMVDFAPVVTARGVGMEHDLGRG
ncbi:MAG TPA: HNH endonuclease family protein [Nocardioides sp.]|nr:HNH endonuclease family protein [Nocardioides sp.]